MQTYKRLFLVLLLASMPVTVLAAELSPETANSEIGGELQPQPENSATDNSPPPDSAPETPSQDTTPEAPPQDTTPEAPPQDSTPETPPQDPAPETPPTNLTPETPPQQPPSTSDKNDKEAEREKREAEEAEREKREEEREKKEAKREKEEAKEEQREAKREAENTKKADNTAVPILQITRGTLPDSIGAEQKFQLQLTVNNLSSSQNIENLTLNFSTSEALLLLDASSLKVVKSLNAGKSVELTLDMQTTKTISTAAQYVTAELKYDYLPVGSLRKNSSVTEKILIPLTPTEEKKKLLSATPGLIISKYDYGGEPIPVGAVFDLKLAFRNTSQKLAVENIVMQLETGEAFSITESSNAFFFASLGAGGTKEQNMQVRALASAKPDTNKITVTFNYEFVDQDTREKVSVSEKLAIPIFQPDRFEITPPQLPENITVGQETVLSFAYVNKGRGELYNVEASLEGNVNMLNAHQNLGNFEAGSSGTIDFVITPQEVGEITLTAKILYEDANMNQKEVLVPVPLTITEPEPELDLDATSEGIDAEGDTPNKWILWVLAGLIAVPVALAALIRKFKKRRLGKAAGNAAWEEPEPADEDGLNGAEGEDDYAEK